MKKRIFAMFILVASMAMVACTSTGTNDGKTSEENQALKLLENRREYYKAQDREKARLEAEAKKAEEEEARKTEERIKKDAARAEEEARKAQEEARLEAEAKEKAMLEAKRAEEEAKRAEEEAKLEALKVLEKKRKEN